MGSSPIPATRPVGQAVKTRPFHGCNMGSIPVRVTKKEQGTQRAPCSYLLSLRFENPSKEYRPRKARRRRLAREIFFLSSRSREFGVRFPPIGWFFYLAQLMDARTHTKEYRPCQARRGCPAREIFFLTSRSREVGVRFPTADTIYSNTIVMLPPSPICRFVKKTAYCQRKRLIEARGKSFSNISSSVVFSVLISISNPLC